MNHETNQIIPSTDLRFDVSEGMRMSGYDINYQISWVGWHPGPRVCIWLPRPVSASCDKALLIVV